MNVNYLKKKKRKKHTNFDGGDAEILRIQLGIIIINRNYKQINCKTVF